MCNIRRLTELIVHWQGNSHADATWEVLSDFQLCYPNFALVGKGNPKREGVLQVYTPMREGLLKEVEVGVCEGNMTEVTEANVAEGSSLDS